MDIVVDTVDHFKNIFQAFSDENIRVVVSPLFFRDYICKMNCGGCCFNTTLDYFPGERVERFKRRHKNLFEKYFTKRIVNGVEVFSDFNEDLRNKGIKWCRYRNSVDGKCIIHPNKPLMCTFSLNQIIHRRVVNEYVLIKKLFGRGWCYTKVDGTKRAICEIVNEYNQERKEDDIMLFKEFGEVSTQLGYDSWRFNEIVKIIQTPGITSVKEKVIIERMKEGSVF